jgi:SAM-dependent methyltransferase
MPRIGPYEAHAARYEAWFDRNPAAFVSELLALRPFVPLAGRGLEIGVGSGRFAAPLGVAVGVDPSPTMLELARTRGIETHLGCAEALPFADGAFDFALVVTTLCFVDSPAQMLAEARRVLRPGGLLTMGFVDLDSPLGRHYERHRAESVFYREATFHTADEVAELLVAAGFTITAWASTLSRSLEDTHEIEPVRASRGHGAFVVVQARTNDGLGQE